MSCKQLVEFPEQYLAGELAVGVPETLESHLATFADCRRHLASYEKTVRLAAFAAKHPDDDPPAEVPDELVQAILSVRRCAKR